MKLRRWDALTVAAVALLSAGVFVALGPGPAWADGLDLNTQVRKALDSAQKHELNGCRISACPATAVAMAGSEQQIILRATNPTSSPVALSLTLSAGEMTFAMSRAALPAKSLKAPVERQVALAIEPGKTVETTVAFNLPAGFYSITARSGQSTATLCSLRAMPFAAAKMAGGQSTPAVTKLSL